VANKERYRSVPPIRSTLFGIGWGLVGLCPGPAVTNLATLSLPVIIFVIAMALGMLAHDFWPARAAVRPA